MRWLLLLLALFLGIAQSKDGPQTPIPPTTSEAQTAKVNAAGNADIRADEAKAKNHQAPDKLTDWLLAIFNGLLVLVTGILGLLAWRQERMARIHERAYIFGGPGGRRTMAYVPIPGRPSPIPKETHICVTVQNYGRTPGFLRKIFYDLCLETDWPDREPHWPRISGMHELVREDVLYPEQKYSELVPIDDTALPLEDGKIYVSYGLLIYTDVFGKEHFSAWKHRVIQKGLIWLTPSIAGTYDRGNWN